MMMVRMKMKMRMRMTTILTSFFGLTIMSRSLLSWMCVIDSVLPRLAQVSCKYVSGGTSLSYQRRHTRRLPDDDEQPYWDGLLPPLLHPFHEPGSKVYLSKLIYVFVKVYFVTGYMHLSAFLYTFHEPGHLPLDELHFNRLHQLGHSSHGLCEGTLQQNQRWWGCFQHAAIAIVVKIFDEINEYKEVEMTQFPCFWVKSFLSFGPEHGNSRTLLWQGLFSGETCQPGMSKLLGNY